MGYLALGTVSTDALEEVLLNGQGSQLGSEPRLSWQTVVTGHSLYSRQTGGTWGSGDTWGTLRTRLRGAAHPESRSTRHAREDGRRRTGTLSGIALLSTRPLFTWCSWESSLSSLPILARRPGDTSTRRSHGSCGSSGPWSSLSTFFSS